MRLRQALLIAAILAPLAAPAVGHSQEQSDPPALGAEPVPAELTPPPATAGAAADSDSQSVTGSVRPESGANPKALAEPAIDSSDPSSGTIAGNALRRTADTDPFAPLGIRVGSCLWYPTVVTSGGYTTNASGTAGGKGAAFAVIAPQLLIQSDWSRNEATLTLRGSYETFTNDNPDEPEAEVLATTRLDLADRWTADFAAHYRYGRESASDPNAPASDRPSDIDNFGGSAALNGALGRQIFTLEGSADRTVYGDAGSGNTTISQGDRDNTLYGGRLRLGYPLTGVTTPFVEGLVTRRQYDDKIDANGIRRSSTGEGIRVGVALDRGPVTVGEVAIGYRQENFDDKALRTFGAFTADGTLAWAPTRLVTLTSNLTTSIDPSTDPVSSGSVVRDATFDLAYAYRQNATANLTGAIRNQQFEGVGRQDWRYQAGISTTWQINRNVMLAAGYVHEWLNSTAKANDYTSDTVRVDLTLRH